MAAMWVNYKIVETLDPLPVTIESSTDYNFANRTLLIVEDDIYNAEYLKEILADTGLNIILTSFGKESVNICLSNTIDLVLMDINLPDLDGYDAINQIIKKKPDLKIIVQTGYAFSGD